LHDAPRRDSHDAERRATKFASTFEIAFFQKSQCIDVRCLGITSGRIFNSFIVGPVMSRCRFVCSTSRRTQNLLIFVIAIAFCFYDLTSCSAQGKRTVLDAIRAVDGQTEKDLEWVTAFLEESIEKNSSDSMANCVLAIAQFRMQEFEKALKSIELANKGDKAKITSATTGKIQLLCAINLEDGATATKLFQGLLNACQRESTPIALRKSFCEWMGEIIGSLDSVEAESPIELELLTKAKKSLIGLAETKLSQAFENQYAKSHAKANEIRKVLEKYSDLGDAGMQELDRTMSDEYEKLKQILDAAVNDSKEMTSENKDVAKRLRDDLKNILQQLRKKELENSRNGPGMPAPVFPPQSQPIAPNRDAIYVDPFVVRTITEFVNNQQVTRVVQTRRDSRDIEAERNAIYQTQFTQYQHLFNNYNAQLSLSIQYKKDLAEWKKTEEQRRKVLNDERKELESQLAQIKTNLDEIVNVNKENSGDNQDLRKSIAQLKGELERVQLVLNAAKTGKPFLALRPKTIDTWLITDERNRLLKLATDNP